VVLTASTSIVDVTGPGRSPRGAGAGARGGIPGSLAKSFPAGTFGVPCALVIGRRRESTD